MMHYLEAAIYFLITKSLPAFEIEVWAKNLQPSKIQGVVRVFPYDKLGWRIFNRNAAIFSSNKHFSFLYWRSAWESLEGLKRIDLKLNNFNKMRFNTPALFFPRNTTQEVIKQKRHEWDQNGQENINYQSSTGKPLLVNETEWQRGIMWQMHNFMFKNSPVSLLFLWIIWLRFYLGKY